MIVYPKTWFESTDKTSRTIAFNTSSFPLIVSNGMSGSIDITIIPSNDSGLTVSFLKGDAEGSYFLPVQVRNDDTDTAINGSTGLALTANTPVRVRVNTNILSRLRLDVTGIAGSITAYAEGVLNDR